NFTVTAYNAEGDVVTGFTDTVQFSSSDPNASLPSSYKFTAADKGSHTFSATLKTAGTQYIQATDTTTQLTGSQSNITVVPATASVLKATGFPTNDTAGVAGNVTVTAYDPYGNVATGYTGTVTLSSSDSKAVLPSSYSFNS